MSHTNSINGIAFSKDGRYLISGSNDRTAKIWDVEDNFTLLDTIYFHSSYVYGVKIINNDGSYFAVTTSFDNKIAVYDIKRKRNITSYKSDYKLMYLAINDKEKHIATCGYSKEILIFDFELNLLHTIQSETKPSGLNYSPNGELLIAGFSFRMIQPTDIVNIYKVNKNYTKKTSFKKHTNLTKAVNFIDINTAISGGGDNYEIYIWDIDSTRVKKKIAGVGNPVWSVGIQGDSIALGNKWTENNGKSKLQKSINLNTFSIKDKPTNLKNFKRISTNNGSYSLSHSKGGDFGVGDAILNIKKDGNIKNSITKDNTNGLGNKCYGWYRNYVISGGTHGHLNIYNKQGKEVASLVGHTGEIWSIAIDGDKLVSGSADQTIKLWDLSKIIKKDSSSRFESIVNSVIENGTVANAGLMKGDIIYAVNNHEFQTAKEMDNAINDPIFYTFHVKRKSKKLKISFQKQVNKPFGFNYNLDDGISQTIYPILNIFVSNDNEWVTWTKEGFFNASKNGAQYIGYHINEGPNKEARYVSVDKLYDTFYRPDLIEKALKGEDISSYAEGISIKEILGAGLAPRVAIKTTKHTTKNKDLSLNLEVCELNGGYDNLTLLLNGTAIDVISKDRALKRKKTSKIKEDCFTFEKLITLTNGENIIGFKATNKAGNIDSNTDTIKVTYKGRSNKRPNLYILAIGVDKYRDGDLWLNYSKADAKVFTKTIKKVSKPLFKNIYTTTLLDKEVTKKNILKTFETIGAKTRREDVFMLYVAGHGITDAKTGAYFYLPVDFRYKNDNSVRESGVSQKDFKLALSKIQAMKSLTILDTCNSGSFTEAMASRGVLQKTAINKLTRATGRATLVASSKDQVALEGYKGHGVFTYTLVEALKGEGYGRDNKITIKELAGYIEDVLPDRTYDKWGYEQVPQSHITGNDFPIGIKENRR